jgi:hypothetical protein
VTKAQQGSIAYSIELSIKGEKETCQVEQKVWKSSFQLKLWCGCLVKDTRMKLIYQTSARPGFGHQHYEEEGINSMKRGSQR